MTSHRDPLLVYNLVLHHLFAGRGDVLDEEEVVKPATGIRATVVWRKRFRFQRDGVVGAIDKLNRYGRCIIADSMGLGKTFEALAIIKYHELRNDRALVLCPKRLRDNWTLYKANDRRNFLAPDRSSYDVLNHTDLSRDDGVSGDIDLAHVNWGNYDLVGIDESHNFRNKRTPQKGGETRYDRLMRRIIKKGVRTRVLMLSATPVNNRMADLRNQIAFATEGDDLALLCGDNYVRRGDAAGVVFCLRAEGPATNRVPQGDYPLAPHYLMHVGDDGNTVLPFTQARRILDQMKRLCVGRGLPDAGACARFDGATEDGEDMRFVQGLLAGAVASVTGKREERAVASLFAAGTHALKGEFAGIGDSEVVAFPAVLPAVRL
ncbi:MAG: SNF2-related protein [Gemmatimonadota bacterium]